MIYEYRCPSCGYAQLSKERGDTMSLLCGWCDQIVVMKRVWSVSLPRPLHAYYDENLKSEVFSNSDYAKKLHRAGQEYTERTGIETNYQPISYEEAKRSTTDEGMRATHDHQVKLGMREGSSKIVK